MSVSSSAWAGDDIPLYKDRTSPIEKRVDDLMSRMTLHEKVLQLQNRASGRLDEIDRIFSGESYGTTHEMSMSAYDCAVMYKELQFLTLPASYAGDVLKKHTEKTLI